MYSNALLGLELIAVLLAVLYLLLAVRQDIRCWIAGIISSLIYLFLMYQANLYMESVLQIFYVFMGIYGWSQWNLNTGKDKALKVSTWSLRRHVIVIFSILGFSFLAGNLLEAYTNAALPFFDSLTTFGALVATYMVAKKKLENWIYWIIADIIYIPLFIYKELYVTSFQYFIFLVLAISGYKEWKKLLRND